MVIIMRIRQIWIYQLGSQINIHYQIQVIILIIEMDLERENRRRIKQFWSNKINRIDKYPLKIQHDNQYVFPRQNKYLRSSNATSKQSEISSIADLYDLNRQNREHCNNHFSSSNLIMFEDSTNIIHRPHHEIQLGNNSDELMPDFDQNPLHCTNIGQKTNKNHIDSKNKVNKLKAERVHRIKISSRVNQSDKNTADNKTKSKTKKISIISHSVNLTKSRTYHQMPSNQQEEVCCCNIFNNLFKKKSNVKLKNASHNGSPQQTLINPIDDQNNRTKSLEVRDRKNNMIPNNMKINLKIINQKNDQHQKSLSLSNQLTHPLHHRSNQKHPISINNKQTQSHSQVHPHPKYNNLDQYISLKCSNTNINNQNKPKYSYYNSTVRKLQAPIVISQFQY